VILKESRKFPLTSFLKYDSIESIEVRPFDKLWVNGRGRYFRSWRGVVDISVRGVVDISVRGELVEP
jgi:hypothetical protein